MNAWDTIATALCDHTCDCDPTGTCDVQASLRALREATEALAAAVRDWSTGEEGSVEGLRLAISRYEAAV